MEVLKTVNLSKKYSDGTGIHNLNLNIKKGDIYGFIGENGAGKTTTLKIVLNLIKEDSGYFEMFGAKIDGKNMKLLNKVGSIIEFPGFYSNLTAKENLKIFARMMDVPKDQINSRIEKYLNLLELDNASHKIVNQFSLGMKQRLGIARALLHEPEFLIFDEPTNGLDPNGIKYIRNLIIKLAKEHGKTILVSSHILSEIQLMATKIGIIHKGNLLKEINIDEFNSVTDKNLIIKCNLLNKAHELIKNTYSDLVISVKDDKLMVKNLNFEPNKINTLLVKNNFVVDEIYIEKQSLENYVLNLIESSDLVC